MSRTKFYMSRGEPFTVEVGIEEFRKGLLNLKGENSHFNISDPVSGSSVTIFVRHIVSMEEVVK